MCSQIEISNSHLQFDRAVEICKEECTIEQQYLAMETDSMNALTQIPIHEHGCTHFSLGLP
jgi:hypothetical protein